MSIQDSRRPGQPTTRAEAIVAAGQEYARACRERDELAAREGARAVALAADYPGHPLSVDEIEAKYLAMQDEARRQRAGKSQTVR